MHEGGLTNFCYTQVLNALTEQDQSKVNDVQVLVRELRRITLLWDELWLGTLNQHQQDITKLVTLCVHSLLFYSCIS